MRFTLLTLLLTLPLMAEVTLTLAWDANPETDIAGYEVYRLNPLTLLGTTTETRMDVTVTAPQTVAVLAMTTEGLKSDLSESLDISEWDAQPMLARAGWVVSASSDGSVGPLGPRNNYHAALAIDDDKTTFWHSEWGFTEREDMIPPHYFQIQLPGPALVSGISYITRLDGEINGTITTYDIQSSSDGVEWEPWAAGSWEATTPRKTVDLPLRSVRYFRLWSSDRYAAMSEIQLSGTYAPAQTMVALQIQSSEDLATWSNIDHLPIATPAKSKEFFRIQLTTPN